MANEENQIKGNNEEPNVIICGLEYGNCARQMKFNMERHDEIVFKEGYEKAVDDFVAMINEMPTYEEDGKLMPMPVEMMAEYLIAKLHGFSGDGEEEKEQKEGAENNDG